MLFYLPKSGDFPIVRTRGVGYGIEKINHKARCNKHLGEFTKANNNFGFKRGFIGECVDGQWLVVTTDDLWEESSTLVDSRYKATKHQRDNGFWTRLRKVQPQ